MAAIVAVDLTPLCSGSRFRGIGTYAFDLATAMAAAPPDDMDLRFLVGGVADYELLSRLAERDPETAMKLVSRHVGSFDRYGCDVQAFRSTRRQLLDRLSSR